MGVFISSTNRRTVSFSLIGDGGIKDGGSSGKRRLATRRPRGEGEKTERGEGEKSERQERRGEETRREEAREEGLPTTVNAPARNPSIGQTGHGHPAFFFPQPWTFAGKQLFAVQATGSAPLGIWDVHSCHSTAVTALLAH
jgi:hypothetical protein